MARDLQAAVLKDAGGLTHRQIGERMGVPAPPDAAYKGDYPVVRQMVGRGRKVLQRTFGVEGWQEKAEGMRVEAERKREEGLAYLTFQVASLLDMSEEEVRPKLDIDPVKGATLSEELRRKFAARPIERPQEDQ